MLLLPEFHALCSSSCCDVEYNVIITFLHTQKKKKLGCFYWLYIIGVVLEEGMLHVVLERVQPVTWDRYGFR
jgi:hypothetical protein